MANPLRAFGSDLRAFITRGNVIELAVAFLLGAAFGEVVRSVSNDLLAPLVGVLLGDLSFVDYFLVLRQGTPPEPYATLEAARSAGAVTLNWGQFVTRVVSFLITAVTLFLIVRYVVSLHRKQERAAQVAAPTTKECPFCRSKISLEATRCPACTSQLPEPSVQTAGSG